MKDNYRIIHCEATDEYMAQREIYLSFDYGIPCDPVWVDVGEWRGFQSLAKEDAYSDGIARTRWLKRETHRTVSTFELG